MHGAVAAADVGWSSNEQQGATNEDDEAQARISVKGCAGSYHDLLYGDDKGQWTSLNFGRGEA